MSEHLDAIRQILAELPPSGPDQDSWLAVEEHLRQLVPGDRLEDLEMTLRNWPAHITMISLSQYAGLKTPPSQTLPYWSVVRGLYIDSMFVDLTDVPALDAIERFADDHTNIQYLHLGDEASYDRSEIDFIDALPGLRSVWLDGPSEISDLSALARCPRLEFASLFGYSNIEECASQLAVLEDCTQLRRLYLGDSFIAHAEDIGTWQFPGGLAERLTHLRLPAWSPLAQDWSRFSSLTELSIVPDEIDPAKPADEIRAADFAGTDIETILQSLAHAPVLRQVFLDSTDLHLAPEQRDALNTIFAEMLANGRQAEQSATPQPVLEVHSASDHEWSALTDRWLAEVDGN